VYKVKRSEHEYVF